MRVKFHFEKNTYLILSSYYRGSADEGNLEAGIVTAYVNNDNGVTKQFYLTSRSADGTDNTCEVSINEFNDWYGSNSRDRNRNRLGSYQRIGYVGTPERPATPELLITPEIALVETQTGEIELLETGHDIVSYFRQGSIYETYANGSSRNITRSRMDIAEEFYTNAMILHSALEDTPIATSNAYSYRSPDFGSPF